MYLQEPFTLSKEQKGQVLEVKKKAEERQSVLQNRKQVNLYCYYLFLRLPDPMNAVKETLCFKALQYFA